MTRGTLVAALLAALAGLPWIAAAGTEADAPPALPGEGGDAAALGAASAEAGAMLRIAATEVMGQITGRASPNDTAVRWDVHGADLGHMFWHRDRLYMVFGDTFGPRGLLGRRNWRSNAMARIADPDPRNGLPIESMIVGPDGRAKELLASRKIGGVEKTVIPTNGVSLDGRMYLHYMSVKRWGDPGRWEVGHSGIAYSDDDGQSWASPADAVWPRGIGFEQVAFVRGDDVLYSFGIPEGRYGDIRLRRVAVEHILARDAYRYWDGNGWGAEPTDAAAVVAGPAGELSVAWSEAHERWVMMYQRPEPRGIVLRTAAELTGPWSDAYLVASGADYPGSYAPYIVPGSTIDTELYYTLSRWEPYNVFLMRTTLEWGAAVAAADAAADAANGAAAGDTAAGTTAADD